MEEPVVEFVVKVPERIADFLEYASKCLGIPVEELLVRMIGDTLVCLSSDMVDPYNSEWANFIDIDLDEALWHALVNLATNYVTLPGMVPKK